MSLWWFIFSTRLKGMPPFSISPSSLIINASRFSLPSENTSPACPQGQSHAMFLSTTAVNSGISPPLPAPSSQGPIEDIDSFSDTETRSAQKPRRRKHTKIIKRKQKTERVPPKSIREQDRKAKKKRKVKRSTSPKNSKYKYRTIYGEDTFAIPEGKIVEYLEQVLQESKVKEEPLIVKSQESETGSSGEVEYFRYCPDASQQRFQPVVPPHSPVNHQKPTTKVVKQEPQKERSFCKYPRFCIPTNRTLTNSFEFADYPLVPKFKKPG